MLKRQRVLYNNLCKKEEEEEERRGRGGREGYLLQTFLSINIAFKENIFHKINF